MKKSQRDLNYYQKMNYESRKKSRKDPNVEEESKNSSNEELPINHRKPLPPELASNLKWALAYKRKRDGKTGNWVFWLIFCSGIAGLSLVALVVIYYSIEDAKDPSKNPDNFQSNQDKQPGQDKQSNQDKQSGQDTHNNNRPEDINATNISSNRNYMDTPNPTNSSKFVNDLILFPPSSADQFIDEETGLEISSDEVKAGFYEIVASK